MFTSAIGYPSRALLCLALLAVVTVSCGNQHTAESHAKMGKVTSQLCGSMVLSANPAVPTISTTSVTLTASATCGAGETAQYQFGYQPPGQSAVTIICNWQPGTTCIWNLSGAASGNYRLIAYSRAAGATSFQSSASIQNYLVGSVCTSPAISFAPPVSGTNVTLTGTATCSGAGSAAEFQFLQVREGTPAGTPYTLIHAYDGTATATWDTTGLPSGSYDVVGQAREDSNNSTWESTIHARYLVGGVCSAVTFSVNPPSPQKLGAQVSITASATCSSGTAAQYQFLYRKPTDASYTVFRDWGAENTATWDTSALPSPGTLYALSVRVRGVNGGTPNLSPFESSAVVNYQLDLCDENFYGAAIVAPGYCLDAPNQPCASPPTNQTYKDFKASVDELKQTLLSITGKNFDLLNSLAPGSACDQDGKVAIYIAQQKELSPNGSGPVPPAAVTTLLDQLSSGGPTKRNSFALYSAAGVPPASASGLWITALHRNGLIHGIYDYLDRLGVRWLLPDPDANPKWRILPPSSASVRRELNTTRIPTIRTMLIGQEFGFGGHDLVDEGNQALKDWTAWLRRNRIPVDYQPPNQNGGDFNTQNEPELSRLPAYRPWVNGATWDFTPAMKWHYTYHGTCNAGVGQCDLGGQAAADSPGIGDYTNFSDYQSFGGIIKLWSEWARAQYQGAVTMDPEGPRTQLVAAEPADGSSPHCTCDKCRNLLRHVPYLNHPNLDSTYSDRVFHLARNIAQYIAYNPPTSPDGTPVPNAGVGLLAHLEHQPPPTVPLLPNMYVHVNFGNSGGFSAMTPDELLQAWSVKRANEGFHLGVSAGWTMSQPDLSPYRALNKVRFWEANQVQGISSSSTMAAGETALTFYALSRHFWDPAQSDTAALDEFFSLAFGPAANHIKGMFNRWWDDSLFNPWHGSTAWWDALRPFPYGGFALTYNEIEMSKRDLADAYNALAAGGCPATSGGGQSCFDRVKDLEAYVQYLVKRKKYEDTINDSDSINPDHDQATGDLAQHMYNMFGTNFVSVWRILRTNLFKGDTCEALPQDVSPAVCHQWHPMTGTAYASPPGTVQPLGPLASPIVEPRQFSATLIPKNPDYADTTIQPTASYNRGQLFAFVKPSGSYSIRLNANSTVTPVPPLPPAPPMRVVITNSAGAQVDSFPSFEPSWMPPIPLASGQQCPADACCITGSVTSCNRSRSLSALPAGQYTLEVIVAALSQAFSLDIPRNLPFSVIGPQHAGSSTIGDEYFYVPQGTSKFRFVQRNYRDREIEFYDPSGEKQTFAPSCTAQSAQCKDGQDEYLFDATGKSGVWRMRGLSSLALSGRMPYIDAFFIGIPNIVAYSAKQLLIPNDPGL